MRYFLSCSRFSFVPTWPCRNCRNSPCFVLGHDQRPVEPQHFDDRLQGFLEHLPSVLQEHGLVGIVDGLEDGDLVAQLFLVILHHFHESDQSFSPGKDLLQEMDGLSGVETPRDGYFAVVAAEKGAGVFLDPGGSVPPQRRNRGIDSTIVIAHVVRRSDPRYPIPSQHRVTGCIFDHRDGFGVVHAGVDPAHPVEDAPGRPEESQEQLRDIGKLVVDDRVEPDVEGSFRVPGDFLHLLEEPDHEAARYPVVLVGQEVFRRGHGAERRRQAGHEIGKPLRVVPADVLNDRARVETVYVVRFVRHAISCL